MLDLRNAGRYARAGFRSSPLSFPGKEPIMRPLFRWKSCGTFIATIGAAALAAILSADPDSRAPDEAKKAPPAKNEREAAGGPTLGGDEQRQRELLEEMRQRAAGTEVRLL